MTVELIMNVIWSRQLICYTLGQSFFVFFVLLSTNCIVRKVAICRPSLFWEKWYMSVCCFAVFSAVRCVYLLDCQSLSVKCPVIVSLS